MSPDTHLHNELLLRPDTLFAGGRASILQDAAYNLPVAELLQVLDYAAVADPQRADSIRGDLLHWMHTYPPAVATEVVRNIVQTFRFRTMPESLYPAVSAALGHIAASARPTPEALQPTLQLLLGLPQKAAMLPFDAQVLHTSGGTAAVPYLAASLCRIKRMCAEGVIDPAHATHFLLEHLARSPHRLARQWCLYGIGYCLPPTENQQTALTAYLNGSNSQLHSAAFCALLQSICAACSPLSSIALPAMARYALRSEDATVQAAALVLCRQWPAPSVPACQEILQQGAAGFAAEWVAATSHAKGYVRVTTSDQHLTDSEARLRRTQASLSAFAAKYFPPVDCPQL